LHNLARSWDGMVKKSEEIKAKDIDVASKPKRAPKKKKKRVVMVSAKRKESVARASVMEGKGIVRINKMKLEALSNTYVKDIISEPVMMASEQAKGLEIAVYMHGGGVIGQAQAARTAIARGIVEFTGDDALRRAFLERDRYILIDDARRVEPKKYKGRKARARFQKSYR